VFGSPFDRGALAGKRLFNVGCPLRVWRTQAVQQPIRAGFEKLRKAGESRESNRIAAPLDVADGLPMHTDEFRQTFLRHVPPQPRLADVLADKAQHLLVRHSGIMERIHSTVDTPHTFR
jgi:hypothetical protein